ncbi:unnamed protein product [Rotaria socialis]|uniref:G-protein coupled receptors family 1 profile domain-containing protein n=1 Tax=Rotaria socialis TaxID=392032 RepID=A0A817QD91_9BILA|nr:unnamed protein product [Rotaria socialis]CAF3306781.1 unnamed protein product [Rotaria socialis]CAF3591006.1 unnamed protein product [Rotaria socialis]CAF3721868.1 unnamed protein product [Rotaria socialis]CAF3725613.1 unnamed protein product [Rotaria socialis]
MQQLSNDTGFWHLIAAPPPSSLLYNSNTYESIPHNRTTGSDINNLILPISSLVNAPILADETSSANYWALTLIIFPLFTIVGNALVVVSVYREKSLHTVTNYFVVSLAISDITVAAVVMPFAIYLEFNRIWELSDRLCDFWVASDCMACTASILNLVAIAIDRYIAVTKPLKYARHKNPRRVAVMIVIVWLTSFFIALPIVSGANKSDVTDYPRVREQCAFFNNKFLIFSSLGSFFIPCIIIFAIYYRIFLVLMRQARKNRKQLRPKAIIESAAAQHRTNADHLITSYYQERPSIINQVSISSPLDLNETVPIKTYNALETQRNSLMLKLSTPVLSPGLCSLINATSLTNEQIEDEERDDVALFVQHEKTYENNKNESENRIENLTSNNNNATNIVHFKKNNRSSQTDYHDHCPYSTKRVKTRLKTKMNSDDSAIPETVIASTNNARVAKRKAYSRMKKERKATQTLIIVLICFLVCWLPFFVLNNIVNTFVKLSKKSSSFLVNDFILSLCVWLGYINSFLNPIIYTIFNMEFRKAFAKILFSPCRSASSS